MNIDWALAGEITVWWIIAGVVASLLLGQIKQYLFKKRIREELRNLLYSSDAAWAVEHRRWMEQRRTQPQIATDALLDVVEDECRAFALDSEMDYPRPAA